MEKTRQVFLSGDEALAQGAYEAGLKVACSYPGTPATEILEYLAQFPEVDTQWSVNEKVAFEVALASAIAGLRSLYSSKHVGLNVAMDPLMTSAYTGVNAGFVAVTADDPGLHSSQNEQDNRLLAKIAKVPLLEPASPREAYEYIKIAFQISEDFDIPVLVRLTTRVAHTKENVTLGTRTEVDQKSFKVDIQKYVMVPGNAYKKHVALEKKLIQLQELSERSPLNRMELNDPALGIICDSVAYLYAKENFPNASYLKLGFTYPFPENKIREFAGKVRELVVIEELEPFIEEEVARLGLKAKAKHPSFRVGELRPEYIPDLIAQKEKTDQPAVTRQPVLCPGCSHQPVFSVLKKLGLTVTGDIGCYTLGALAPLSSLHTCLCMGSGITFFEGFKKALSQNVVGVIGDSTFVHTGIPGLINLAYNRTKGVIIILDNGTTAMTGSQNHPATGLTVKKEPTRKLSLESICASCGADNVDVISSYKVKELEELVAKRLAEDALTVIITRATCQIVLKREKRTNG